MGASKGLCTKGASSNGRYPRKRARSRSGEKREGHVAAEQVMFARVVSGGQLGLLHPARPGLAEDVRRAGMKASSPFRAASMTITLPMTAMPLPKELYGWGSSGSSRVGTGFWA